MAEFGQRCKSELVRKRNLKKNGTGAIGHQSGKTAYLRNPHIFCKNVLKINHRLKCKTVKLEKKT